MITEKQAIDIAAQAGLETFLKTAHPDALMTVGSHENFTKALNLAAYEAIKHMAKLMSYREPQDEFKPFAIETWLLEQAVKYQQAAKGEMPC